MKLSNPAAIKTVSLLASWVLRGWMSQTDFHIHADDPASQPFPMTTPKLYLFWHETLFLPTYAFRRRKFAALISSHRDGELAAQIWRMLGGMSVRGSSTRGGASAVRDMLRKARAGHLVITPDGPRGPRRVVQNGAIFVASRTGMPIVAAGIAAREAWRLRSWDKMIIPRFGRPAWMFGAAPIYVPPDLSTQELETYRLRVQAALDEVQRRADAAACYKK